MENIDENESEENQRMAFDTVVTGRNCVVTSDFHHSAGKRDRCFYKVHVDGICL